MNIIELANKSGLTYYGMGKDRARFIHHLENFAALVAAHEREACADIAEHWRSNGSPRVGVAAAIRARGTT